MLYTDGVVKVANRQGCPLGYPAWMALLAAIVKDEILGILGFIREKSNAAVTGNSPASSTTSVAN